MTYCIKPLYLLGGDGEWRIVSTYFAVRILKVTSFISSSHSLSFIGTIILSTILSWMGLLVRCFYSRVAYCTGLDNSCHNISAIYMRLVKRILWYMCKPDTWQLHNVTYITVHFSNKLLYCFLSTREFIYGRIDLTILARYLWNLLWHPAGVCCC